MQNFSMKFWICAGKLGGNIVDAGKKCIQKHTENQKMWELFLAYSSGLVYPVELLKVGKGMRIYVIWCACILYSYFQNAFDKIPC